MLRASGPFWHSSGTSWHIYRTMALPISYPAYEKLMKPIAMFLALTMLLCVLSPKKCCPCTIFNMRPNYDKNETPFINSVDWDNISRFRQYYRTTILTARHVTLSTPRWRHRRTFLEKGTEIVVIQNFVVSLKKTVEQIVEFANISQTIFKRISLNENV